MLSGAHAILYSKDAEADRAVLRDVLGLPHVNVGGGWLIFGLPPSEIAVHPAARSGKHELYFMCDDIATFVTGMRGHGLRCGPVKNAGWGLLTSLKLPGGSAVGVYQPRHKRPPSAKVRARKPARRKRAR